MKIHRKKIAPIIGIIVGVVIIVIGFSLQDTYNYSIGKSIEFGADFYTEMYAVTKDVGRAINSAINDLICAISWLIISLGAIDICFFTYQLVMFNDKSKKPEADNLLSNSDKLQKQNTCDFCLQSKKGIKIYTSKKTNLQNYVCAKNAQKRITISK